MSTLFILAATTISLAFVFYTIGVFAERRNGTLKNGTPRFFGWALLLIRLEQH